MLDNVFPSLQTSSLSKSLCITSRSDLRVTCRKMSAITPRSQRAFLWRIRYPALLENAEHQLIRKCFGEKNIMGPYQGFVCPIMYESALLCLKCTLAQLLLDGCLAKKQKRRIVYRVAMVCFDTLNLSVHYLLQ